MTTQYSLKEFHDKVRELAKSNDKEYVAISVAMSNDGDITFSCYIDGYNYVNGSTPQESLEKMRNLINPVPKLTSQDDVIVEVLAQEQLS